MCISFVKQTKTRPSTEINKLTKKKLLVEEKLAMEKNKQSNNDKCAQKSFLPRNAIKC